MPSFDIIKESEYISSFRVDQVKNAFSISDTKITEHFAGEIPFESQKWNVGLIVGRSGTGKTSIIKDLFPDVDISPKQYGSRPIIDEMPAGCSFKDITHTFTSVGFSSPPSWLKPYSVLSNGERMRVDLARAILEGGEVIVFDEFTSVVDRDIAKVCSYAISKAIRRENKKFIAVSCHADITDWLEPDWIFDTNRMTYTFRGHQRTRPKIAIEIYRSDNKHKKRLWEIFRRYHYLNTDLHQSATQYIGFIGDTPVCHTGIMQFPLQAGWKRVHRLVVLPDYQGVGIGKAFISAIADMYKTAGKRVYLITSTPAIVPGLVRDPRWILTRQGRSRMWDVKVSASSLNRITFSFVYKGAV